MKAGAVHQYKFNEILYYNICATPKNAPPEWMLVKVIKIQVYTLGKKIHFPPANCHAVHL